MKSSKSSQVKSSQVAQHHRHRPPALGVQCVGRPAAARALGSAQRVWQGLLEPLHGRQRASVRVCDEQLRGTFFPADGSVAVGMSLADFESGCKGDEMRPGRFVRIVGGETLVCTHGTATRERFCLRFSAHVALIITSCTSPGASALKPSTSAPDSLGSPVSSSSISSPHADHLAARPRGPLLGRRRAHSIGCHWLSVVYV